MTDVVSELLGATSPTITETVTESTPVGEVTPTPAPETVTPETTAETVTDTDYAKAAIEADAILEKLMSRITDPADVAYRKMMLYAPFGTGKTVFCATAPDCLIVRVEPTGTLSLMNHPELKAKTFEYLSVTQLEILLNKMIEKPEAFPFKTLAIDSFSALQKDDLDAIVRAESAKDANRNPFLPTGPDYNVNTEHMRQIGVLLSRLKMHVIVTCHVKETKDDTTGRVLIRPDLTPKLANTLAGQFDVVAYMSRADDGTRKLQTSPTATVLAKTRVGGLPDVIENPTWDNVFNAANANKATPVAATTNA